MSTKYFTNFQTHLFLPFFINGHLLSCPKQQQQKKRNKNNIHKQKLLKLLRPDISFCYSLSTLKSHSSSALLLFSDALFCFASCSSRAIQISQQWLNCLLTGFDSVILREFHLSVIWKIQGKNFI